MHGDDLPTENPLLVSTSVTQCCQFNAAVLVPYMDIISSPHMPSSSGVLSSSQSSTNVGCCDFA
eukprot:7720763-Karenia_brevis.AAC.1